MKERRISRAEFRRAKAFTKQFSKSSTEQALERSRAHMVQADYLMQTSGKWLVISVVFLGIALVLQLVRLVWL